MMETLVVVVPPHRNQYCSTDKSHQGGSSHPSKGVFRDINCRTSFDSGLLPTPIRSCSTPKPHKSPLPSPKTAPTTPSSNTNPFSKSVDNKHHNNLKKNVKSSPIPINLKGSGGGGGNKVRHLSGSISLSEIFVSPTRSNSPPISGGGCGGGSLKLVGRKEWVRCGNNTYYSERWAGPTYSNSPPPSSLPIPKFSVTKPKRTVSLELPRADITSELDIPPVSKTAPASPTRESSNCSSPSSLFDDDSATKTLRRILNLDGCDDD